MVDFNEIAERVTIRDILADAALNPERSRMACPLHGGKNKTSFSFTDSTFVCHSCGKSGGLLDLVQYLHQCNRREALKLLCSHASVPWSDEPGGGGGIIPDKASHCSRRLHRYSAKYREAESRLEWLELYRHGLDVLLQMLRRNVKLGRVPLSEFYAKEQLYLYELEELDPRIAEAKYETNRLRRGQNRNGNTQPHC